MVGQLPTGAGNPAVEWSAQFLGRGGMALFLTLGYGVLLVSTIRRRAWGEVSAVVLTAVLVTAAVHVQKLVFSQWLPRPTGSAGGFPSGHAAAACGLAFLLSVYFPRWAAAAWGAAVAISWSRVPTLGHFPYQVLVGAATGYLVTLAVSDRVAGPSGYQDFVRRYQVPLVLLIPLVAVLYRDHELENSLISLGGAAVLVAGGVALWMWLRLAPAQEETQARRLGYLANALLGTGVILGLELPWLVLLELLVCLAVYTVGERQPAAERSRREPSRIGRLGSLNARWGRELAWTALCAMIVLKELLA